MRQKKLNRREFLGRSGGMAGAAGLLTQERSNTIRRPDGYDDSFIFERKRFTWPGGKTLALWIIPNVEVWQFVSMANSIITRPSVSGTALDSAASIHRNQTWEVKDGRQHLFQVCVHSAPSACDAY